MESKHPGAIPTQVKRVLSRARRETNAIVREQLKTQNVSPERQGMILKGIQTATQTEALFVRRIYA